jgi:sodium/proline symporter
MTTKGAVVGIIVGGFTALIWKQIHGGIFDLYEIVPGFLFSSIAIFIVSLLDKKPCKEVLEQFEKVQQKLK